MSLASFTPAIWSSKLLVRLRKALIAANLVNTDYQGEITEAGDRVKINEIGPITVNAYTKGATLTYEELASAQKELIIDQQKYFAFSVDDIDKAQNKPNVINGAMDEAAYAIADTIDQHILGLYSYAGVTNTTYMGSSSSAISVSTGNVILTLSYAARYLSDYNAPTQGRWMVVPPWLHQKLLLAEIGGIASTGVPKTNDAGIAINGFIGRWNGFDMYVSNNVQSSATSVSAILAGTRQAISYAGQITLVEPLRLQTTIANAVRGLYVYGSKVVQPYALACLHLTEVAG